ncbi:MAG TPA: lipoate--protein ligase [Ignavibacteriales bacterium]|nr:lipoate--protein ligase [Ignavibacteriales bacterium]HOL80208.1 lipoate--protein ligase [Ignavibacteriales bacterium]HOM64489.1 lipoate--protein ligase [Ignavibacteriales bacterium]HPD66586.1 lipoate--protein ligase [Ignavibacteriales bacterium]HPP32397.1 lipoate--protein ligase [Ignavibacteriales bacterium]
MLLYISKSNFPYHNLAVDEYFVREFYKENGEDILHIYINDKSVILGKNQSIYTELNLPYLHQNKIPIYRRISGGGTVYQDLGNINISFVTRFESKNFNQYRHLTQPLVELLQEFNINAYHTERNDIFVDGYKISGNAQFTTKDVILTHGTLLFDADIKNLQNALHKMDIEVETYASNSVKSSVKNLKDYLPKIDIHELLSLIVQKYRQYYDIKLVEDLDFNKIIAYINKYKNVDWNLYETPPAKIKTKVLNQNTVFDVILIVKNCKIIDFEYDGNIKVDINRVSKLIGSYYLPFETTIIKI